MTETRVIVAAERTLFRQGLVALISEHPEFVVVGECSTSDEARRVSLHERPNVILLDSDLMRTDGGCDLVMCLRADCPEADIMVIGEAILAAGCEEEAEAALPREERSLVLQKGAAAYLPARADRSELLRMLSHIASLHQDEPNAACTHHPSKSANGNNTPRHKVTERERAVIAMVAQGMCNKEVAHRLGISTQTVKNHVSHLLDKLALADRTQLAVYAVEHHFEF